MHLGVEIGKHVSHQELLDHHHAVIYAVGALGDRRLEVPGEDLEGSYACRDFVAWYNGHPDYADRTFDLSSERAVIVGNGNVALDVARILVADVDALERTDVADHALKALRNSNIREVVVLGRRGPAQAAYTNPEFLALRSLPGVDIVIDSDEAELDPHSQRLIDSGEAEPAVRIKAELAREAAKVPSSGAQKRIVFRYLVSPTEVLGQEHVTGLRLVRNALTQGEGGVLRATPSEQTETIDAGLVLRSIGYLGTAVAGVPFDARRGTVPNVGGRVIEPASGEAVVGVYVTGWIKRGPSGVIGTNKRCASDTVGLLLDDFENRRLAMPSGDQAAMEALARERQPDLLSFADWIQIDEAELAAGAARRRPRVKLTDISEMLAVVKAG